jgi:plastocyanin
VQLRRIALSLVAAATTAVIVLVPAYGKTAALKGEVGPGFTIDVEKGGRDLKTIKAGTYTIKIEDRATIHNFHLIGPGLNKKTGVAFKGETTWKIKLKPGRYTYQCDPHHASGMKGTFRVVS